MDNLIPNETTSTKQSIPHCLDWASAYKLSEEEANEIANPDWIINSLIIQGHIVLIPAEPNGGKTTIMLHLAGKMVKEGFNVFYVNSDTSGGDAKPMIEQASDNGFTLMLPDMKVGKSMDTVLGNLRGMSESGERFDKVIFIFDTLKKMVDVISKSSAKDLFILLRKLSAKGMTIVLLAHTNKYKDDDGSPIYEGTGDMRSDVDDLIYLIPQKHDDGSMTVTTKPDKQRGAFLPISFKIDASRQVTQLNMPVDTAKANKNAAEIMKDKAVIDSINNALSTGSMTQKYIMDYCSENDSIGERKIKNVLNKYTIGNTQSINAVDSKNEHGDKIWKRASGEKNSHYYSMIEPA